MVGGNFVTNCLKLSEFLFGMLYGLQTKVRRVIVLVVMVSAHDELLQLFGVLVFECAGICLVRAVVETVIK